MWANSHQLQRRRRSRNVLTPAEVDARNTELQRTTATTVPAATREKAQCEVLYVLKRCGKQLTYRRHRRLNPERRTAHGQLHIRDIVQ
jgi:hypothetical protein